MILLSLILFSLTLYFAQNKSRVSSPISNIRRNWCYLLGVVGVVQLLMGLRYNPRHYFIGAFIIAWTWFIYEARKGQKITWKTTVKSVVLILSSFVFLAAVDLPNSWIPMVIQAILMTLVIALKGAFRSIAYKKVSHFLNNNSDSMIEEERNHSKLSKKTKRLIYWIGGIILFILLLPFIIFTIDKVVNGYMDYFYSVQHLSDSEEVDSCVVTDDVPISDIIYYRSDGTVEVYPIEEYYNSADSCAE